jgi:hypothetical protein
MHSHLDLKKSHFDSRNRVPDAEAGECDYSANENTVNMFVNFGWEEVNWS